MPSVLIELGFISNADEERYLNSAQGQDYLASAVFRAFRDYKETIDSRSGLRPGNYVQVKEEPELRTDSAAKPVAESSGKQVSVVKGAEATAEGMETVPTAAPVQSAAEVQVNAPPNDNEAQPATAADDIFFMVQISAMPREREMSQSQLKGIETITRIDDGERIKYAAGKFPVYDDAIKYRRTLVLRFPDAFVIAVRNGKVMPLREAIDANKQK